MDPPKGGEITVKTVVVDHDPIKNNDSNDDESSSTTAATVIDPSNHKSLLSASFAHGKDEQALVRPVKMATWGEQQQQQEEDNEKRLIQKGLTMPLHHHPQFEIAGPVIMVGESRSSNHDERSTLEESQQQQQHEQQQQVPPQEQYTDAENAMSDDELSQVDENQTALPCMIYNNNCDLPLGEADLDEDEFGEATWEEVVQSCCCHTMEEWFWIGLRMLCVLTFLYFFLFGLELLASGAKVMSGCRAGEMFGDDTNPIAGVMVGILATVLLQSSSTTTSIIVSLVGDNDGSGTITVSQGIYMVMGANIGTSITNTIVAMGFSNNGEQLERAFAGATVHDMFNFMSVAVLLPIEVITNFLEKMTLAITRNISTKNEDDWEGPVKRIVAPLGKQVIIPNKKMTEQIAKGDYSCNDYYPISCEGGGTPTYKSCNGKFGLIACDKDHNFCPAFFSVNASSSDDKVSGGVVFFIAIIILFFCLLALVASLQKLLLGISTRIVYKATDVNGYVAIVMGAAITMLVQSSSITTSTLTPLVGIGV